MSKLNWNYDEVKKGATEEGFLNLIEGPQPAKILDAVNVEDKKYLKIKFDLTEGAFKNYYKNKFENDTSQDKKWKGIVYLSYKVSAKHMFASFMTALEKSNPGFVFDKDKDWIKQIKGKLFVANLADFEYISSDTDDKGKFIVKTFTKYYRARSREALKNDEIKVPKLQELTQKDFEYKGITENEITREPYFESDNNNKEEINTGNYKKVEEDLPF